MTQFKGPTIAGAAGIALALAGLGAQLAGWRIEWLGIVIFAIGVLVLVGGLTWAGARWLTPRVIARVAEVVKDDHRADINRKRELRKAINGVREEIEYLYDRVIDDQGGYWYRGHRLPARQWEQFGPLIAEEHDEAHAALRTVYREADAINHDIDSQVAVDAEPHVPDRRAKRLRGFVREAHAALDAIDLSD
jgi:hypothetical protein